MSTGYAETIAQSRISCGFHKHNIVCTLASDSLSVFDASQSNFLRFESDLLALTASRECLEGSRYQFQPFALHSARETSSGTTYTKQIFCFGVSEGSIRSHG